MSEEFDRQPENPDYPVALRRRSRRRRSVYTRPEKRIRAWVALSLLIVAALGVLFYKFYPTAHFAVALNGTPIVPVESKLKGESIIRQVKERFAPDLPEVVFFTEGELSVVKLNKQMHAVDTRQALTDLEKRLTPELQGYAILVNGNPIVLLPSKADAAKALMFAQEAGMADKQGVPTFVERVVVAPYTQTRERKIQIPAMPPREAAAELTHPPRPRYATVDKGGSFYAIATARGLTVEQIKQLNPKLDPGALQPGDQVRLPDERAPLTVEVREEKK